MYNNKYKFNSLALQDEYTDWHNNKVKTSENKMQQLVDNIETCENLDEKKLLQESEMVTYTKAKYIISKNQRFLNESISKDFIKKMKKYCRQKEAKK